MTDLIQSLSSETGMGADQIRGALAQLFAFLKHHLDPELFSKLEAHLPGASDLPEAEGSSPGGGLLGSIGGAIGKILGGKAGEGIDLLSVLSKSGLSLENIKVLLSRVVPYLEAHLPAELLDQIKSHLALPAE